MSVPALATEPHYIIEAVVLNSDAVSQSENVHWQTQFAYKPEYAQQVEEAIEARTRVDRAQSLETDKEIEKFTKPGSSLAI